MSEDAKWLGSFMGSEIDRLRAELAARDALLKEALDNFGEVLRQSDRAAPTWDAAWATHRAIDAALAKGGGDE